MKNILKIIILFTSSLTFLSCDKNQILLGFSAELTGINADLGVQGRNGVTLAVEEINESGGINGKRIKLLIKDDQGTPEKAMEADKELIKSGVIAIIGHMTSSLSIASIPLMNKEKTVLLSPTTSSEKVTGIKDYFFRVQGSLGFSARILGEYADQDKNIKNVLILLDSKNKEYGIPFKTNFLNGFQRESQKKADTIEFSSLDDFSWNNKIKEINTDLYDGILIIASPVSTAVIIQAIRKKDKRLIIFSSSWSANQYLIQHGGRAVDGIFLAKTAVVNTEHPNHLSYANKYMARFGRPPSFAANNGYHAAKLLAIALEKNNGEKQGLAQVLSNLKKYEYFYGKSGLDEFGDAYSKAMILTIHDGTFKKIYESFSIEEKKAR